MMKKARFSILILAALVIFPRVIAKGEEKAKTYTPISYGRAMIVDKVIEIGIDHKGVKLEAITFSGQEALFIAWNRTPSSVKASVGVALFDEKNRLMAAESSRTAGIRSGKQTNYKINFKKFLHDFKGATHFHLVFVLVD